MKSYEFTQAIVAAVDRACEERITVYVIVDGAAHDLDDDVMVTVTVLEPGEYDQIQANINEGADSGRDNDPAG